MGWIYRKLRLLWAIFKIFRDSKDVNALFEITRYGTPTEALHVSTEHILGFTACKDLYQEKYMPPRTDISRISALPTHTLGHAYASYLKTNKLNPDFYPPIDVVDAATYFRLRMSQTHDIWHVVLGYDTSIPGEVGLNAFYFSQALYPQAGFIVGGAVIKSLFKHPKDAKAIMTKAAEGWLLGQAAKPFLSVKWETLWERNLEELRSELNVLSRS